MNNNSCGSDYRIGYHGTDFGGMVGILSHGKLKCSPGVSERANGAPLVYITPSFRRACRYPIRHVGIRYIFEVAVPGSSTWTSRLAFQYKQWGFSDPMRLVLRSVTIVSPKWEQAAEEAAKLRARLRAKELVMIILMLQ